MGFDVTYCHHMLWSISVLFIDVVYTDYMVNAPVLPESYKLEINDPGLIVLSAINLRDCITIFCQNNHIVNSSKIFKG